MRREGCWYLRDKRVRETRKRTMWVAWIEMSGRGVLLLTHIEFKLGSFSFKEDNIGNIEFKYGTIIIDFHI